jgi:hypothetical protein
MLRTCFVLGVAVVLLPVTLRRMTIFVEVPAKPPARLVTHADFGFVFRVGDASHLMVAPLSEGVPLPAHGPLVFTTSAEGEEAVVAEVALSDVPATHRALVDHGVTVAGGCTARVLGFAIVARLSGDTAYAGASGTWDTASVWEHGAKALTARLDGCYGAYGRDASLRPIQEAIPERDDAARGLALADFLGTEAVAAAQRDYEKQGGKGSFQDADDEVLDVRVVRHPTTGVRWVMIFANVNEGCGGAQIHLAASYRIVADGRVALASLDTLDDMARVDHLVDLDGDGVFELVTHDWLGTSAQLRDAHGHILVESTVPYFGCPC